MWACVEGEHATVSRPVPARVGRHQDRGIAHAGAAGELDVRVSFGPAVDHGRYRGLVFSRLGNLLQYFIGGPAGRAALGRYWSLLGRLGARSLADDSRDQRSRSASGGPVLADLDGQHFHLRHLLIEELHQALQRGRDLIGHEDEPDLALSQVRPDRVPEPRGHVLRVVASGVQLGHQLLGRGLGLITFEPSAQLLRQPKRRTVGRIIQHLGYDLTPGPRVTSPLHLNERRHRILVDDKVIH